MKLSTPKGIAIAAAIFMALISSLTYLASVFIFELSFSIYYLLLFFFSIGIISYFLILTLIEKFINSKIKIIFKTIHNLKSSNEKVNLSMNDDILRQLNASVVNWDKKRKNEIAELESRENFRREFIGNVAHELKTPIFSIQGYILTLLEGAVDDPNVNRKFLERAQKGVDRMTHIIEDLDVITRMESGNLELEYETVNIVDLVKDIIDELEYKANKKNITLKLKEDFKAINVCVDKARIAQVLTNLLVNSINYGNIDGTTIVSFYDLDENILVEVKDNGLGISEDKLSRVFERFYRVDKSRSRQSGGTGLGLAICKHILENHGQTISVTSGIGKETTFSFTLPKNQPKD